MHSWKLTSFVISDCITALDRHLTIGPAQISMAHFLSPFRLRLSCAQFKMSSSQNRLLVNVHQQSNYPIDFVCTATSHLASNVGQSVGDLKSHFKRKYSSAYIRLYAVGTVVQLDVDARAAQSQTPSQSNADKRSLDNEETFNSLVSVWPVTCPSQCHWLVAITNGWYRLAEIRANKAFQWQECNTGEKKHKTNIGSGSSWPQLK